MALSTPTDRSFATRAPRLGFIGGFDGFRGIGISLVMLAHIFPNQTESFQPIVDGFFVISAFLITSLLLQEHRTFGRLNLRKFYARRAIRLLPNSYAAMAAWMVLWGLGTAFVDPNAPGIKSADLAQLRAIPGNVAAAGLYVYHLVYPPAATVGPLNQFWSLSVEEQFYGVAGISVVWMLVSRRRVGWTCALMAGAFVYVAWSRFVVDLGPWPGKLYENDVWTRGLRSLWSVRPDAFFVGIILAVLNALIPEPLSSRARRIIVVTGTSGGILMALILASSLDIAGFPHLLGLPRYVTNGKTELLCAVRKGAALAPCTDRMWLLRWIYSAFSLAIAPFTLCVARVKDCRLARVMSWKPFRFVGERSYSLYIWHLLAYLLATIVVGGMVEGMGLAGTRTAEAISVVARLVAAFAIAELAHRYIDRWMLRFKVRFATAPPTEPA